MDGWHAEWNGAAAPVSPSLRALLRRTTSAYKGPIRATIKMPRKIRDLQRR